MSATVLKQSSAHTSIEGLPLKVIVSMINRVSGSASQHLASRHSMHMVYNAYTVMSMIGVLVYWQT